MADPILDPFHRQLAPLLLDALEARKNALAQGSAKTRGDNETVGERYAEEVGYINGLTDAINLAAEVERLILTAGTRAAEVDYN